MKERTPMRVLLAWLLAVLLIGSPTVDAQVQLSNRTLKIVTISHEPFVMPDGSGGGFQGFYMDLLALLQRELGFRSRVYLVPDSKYGRRDADTGAWSGLIGEVANKKADLSLATLRITGERLKAVDFTVPVSSSGLSILYKRTELQASRAKVLVEPFAASTWVLLLLMWLIYTALAFAIWLVSPYELNGLDLPAAARVRKAGCAAFMLMTGGLFLQGFARSPKSASARILSAAWWLFALATACCYMANLVPAMTGSRRPDASQAADLRDLMRRMSVPLGVLRGGATEAMLASSNLPEFRAANAYLSRNPQQNVNSTSQAVEKVKLGGLAWIGEAVSLDYQAQAVCSLVSVPAGLSTFDFGLAMAKGSELKPLLDAAIVKVKSNGELDSLKQRWFWSSGAGGCDSAQGPLSPGELLALYLVLLLGAVAAAAAMPVEFYLKSGQLPFCGGASGAEEMATASEQKEDNSAPTPESAPAAASAAAAAAVTEEKPQQQAESVPLV